MTYVPPNTDSYEVILIRTALEPRFAKQVFSMATTDHFGSPAMKQVFHAAKTIHFAGKELTADTLKFVLVASENDEGVVGDWLAPIMLAQPSAGAEYLVKLLASSRQKQLIYELGTSLTSQATAGKPVEVAMGEINKFALAQATLTTGRFETLFEAMYRVATRKEPPMVLTPKMGALDNYMRFRRGSFSIIAAESGGGKTSKMINLMVSFAKQGVPSACASIEMTNEELAVRVGALLAGLDSERIEDGLLSEVELQHLKYTMQTNKHILDLIHVVDPATLDVDAVAGLLNDAITKYGVGAFFLDYLQKCQAKGPLVHNQTDRVTYVSATLTADAKRTGIPIIALSQFNRSSGDKGMTNLKNSSQIENDGHSIFILEQYGEDVGDTRYIICKTVKNRKGKRGNELLVLHLSTQRFEHSGRPWHEVEAEINARRKKDKGAPF